ncbi:uncharacterized protein LOC105390889 [Plutella xylostella]|uniref:uncharacterized protein LOC105390889 n=1 Tax=Plutella xylostella TaxID=51655 RepID=UPI0020328ED7|nr:uncharacterized protein LOC105390889 [Plutella xylostella]
MNAMAQMERLKGRENFTTWSFTMKTYLEHEDLWKCIEPEEKQVISAAEDTKAKSKIILLVDPINYIHVQEAKTAKEVWANLRKAFDDSGLTRKVGLLRELITTDLESSGNVESYVNKVISCAHKLRNIGFLVDDEWLGTLLLAGLPETYRPMIMAMESSGVKISTDLVKTKILQEVKNENDSEAFYSNHHKRNEYKSSGFRKGPRCFKCNKYGHIARNCYTGTGSSQRTKSKDDEKTSGYVAAFSASASSVENGCWYIDSGAAMHMTNNNEWMYNTGPSTVPSIRVADNKTLTVKCCGNVDLNVNDGVVQLKNVLYVPDLSVNLLSVRQMTQNNCHVEFEKDCCKVYQNKKLVLTGHAQNNLFVVNNDCYALLTSAHLWHQRMGHLNYKDLMKLEDCTEGVQMDHKTENAILCTTCLAGKQTRQPFKHTGTRASALLEVIHSDVCGPMEEQSLGGARYYVTFIDDYSRKVFVYFIQAKSEVLSKFKEFKNMVENQLDRKIKVLRSDNGGEYVNEAFDKFCRDAGIIQQHTIPYTPEQNGMSERMNRTLTERAKCINANLPKKFWAEAISTAAYVTNRSPTKSLDYKTPEEIWTGKRPDVSSMKVFGCKAMMHVPKERRLKWDSKSKEVIFLGYCTESKGYRLYDMKQKKVVKGRDVVFIEDSVKKDFTITLSDMSTQDNEENKDNNNCTRKVSSVKDNSIDVSIQDDDEDYVPDGPVQITMPPTQRNLRPRKNVMPTYLCESEDIVSDPHTAQEALASNNALKWKEAMDCEYNSLVENNTWTLCDLPSGCKAIPCKWVFKTKMDDKGNISRHKARLVIKGYEQREGIDYTEVYAPVVRSTSLRHMIGLAAKLKLDIEQLDAMTAFLQGDIDVELYMEQPSQYENGTQQVCRLQIK